MVEHCCCMHDTSYHKMSNTLEAELDQELDYLISSCGLNMPLRNSSLSTENLDSNSAFNKPSPTSPPSAPTDKEKLLPTHSTPAEMKTASNSVAGVLMRHERRGSLNTNCPRVGNTVATSSATTNQASHNAARPQRPATVSYELSDDIKEKEIELTERRFGGRLRAQRAARLIQHGYREYRMRREYDRLKSEKRTSRRIDNIQRSAGGLLGENPLIKQVPEEPMMNRQASVEDLVLERAYWDWQEPGRYGDTSSGDRTPHRNSTSSKPEITSDCNISGSNTNVGSRITTSRDSGVDADGQSLTSASGPSNSNSTSSMNSANSDAIVVPNSSHGHSINSEPASCGTLTPASVSSTSSAISSTPTLSPIHIVQGSAIISSYPNLSHSNNISPSQLVKESPIRVSNTLTHYDSPSITISPVVSKTQASSSTSSKSSLQSVTEQSVSPSMHSVSRPSHPLGHSKAFGAPSCCHNQEKRRKRMYRIGLNIFNKQPLKGIDMMVKWNFIENSPSAIARFLITRKGLSRFAIGEFLGNIKSDLTKNVTRQFMREIDLYNKEVDIALRHMMSYFQTPGESQKISHILDEFNFAYVEQNPIRAGAQFRNTDSIMVLCYAIIMLHTDMYNPSIRPPNKMTRDDFVRNLRGTDEGEDMDINLLYSIYDRVRAEEIKAMPDHTDQVRKIDEHLTGPLRPTNLVQPHRRLVCYCRLYQVMDIQKKERPTSHQRDVFLFNDIMLVTKTIQKKKKDGTVYQCKNTISLLGVQVFLFETPYYPFGIQIKRVIDGQVLATFNTKSFQDRERFVEDLQECVLEVSEMDRIRIDEELSKQQRSNDSSNNYPNNACHSANHSSNPPQSGASCTLYAHPCPCQRSRSSSHSSSNSAAMKQQQQPISMYAPVASQKSSSSSGGRVSVAHCMSHHHHHHHHHQQQHQQQHLHQSYPQYQQQSLVTYHPRVPQNPVTNFNRGSGDSGLVADMDSKLY